MTLSQLEPSAKATTGFKTNFSNRQKAPGDKVFNKATRYFYFFKKKPGLIIEQLDRMNKKCHSSKPRLDSMSEFKSDPSQFAKALMISATSFGFDKSGRCPDGIVSEAVKVIR